MKVSELKKALEGLPDDMQIIMQKDGEGNGYSPLAGADPGSIYIKDNEWSGDVFDTRWSASDACMEDEEWEEFKKQPRALILYPVN